MDNPENTTNIGHIGTEDEDKHNKAIQKKKTEQISKADPIKNQRWIRCSWRLKQAIPAA